MRRARVLAIVLAACGVTACNPAVDRSIVLEEEFETLCDGVPCGWVLASGPEGAATWIETLPGDHGLMLTGEGVFVRGGPAPPPPSPVFADNLALRASARCDPFAFLTLRTTIETTDVPSRLVTFQADLVVDDTWEPMPRDVTMVPVDADLSPWNVSRVLGVSVLKSGPGSCEIDYLAIRGVNTPF